MQKLYFNNIGPGFTTIHKYVQSLRGGVNNLCDMTSQEKVLIEESFDDYIMYIWLHLGDTLFNRNGYRNATDILSKKIFNC